MELAKNYNPKDFEEKIYKEWLEKGYFTPDENSDKESYTIVIPPPNITGQLHMGHALNNTIQDIIIRAKRMQGYNTLWVPGTDHASIATENKIVQKLTSEGIKKEELGREKFLEKAWEWKQQYGGKIIEQLKKLGSSCDFTRERFTLDEGLSKAVEEVFIRLYNEGLIYRGERIVNWCPKCKTSISDEEIEYTETDGKMYHIRYEYEDKSGYIEVATTRPETMLGDTAVAVNPSDDRYKKYIGKNVIIPIINKPIPIVADDYADKEFGTGVVKITPAHDSNDFEVGIRHNLDIIKVIGLDGKMNENAGEYKGLDRYEARAKIADELQKQGALIKIESYKHNVSSCYRCKTAIEPDVSYQWFVKMKTLAEPAIEAVRNGEIKFTPERFEKTYFNWMENIQDWCISRQLWWGHRIPAYYCDDCNEIIVSKDKATKCTKCGSNNIRQDEDTFDTWFSSALWPFSTLGWPDKTIDMEKFFPTNTLVTAYDIITFWVSKMIFSSLKFTGKKPFTDVVIHGLIRDSEGRKMSKSLGNGIDPLEVIDEYGADALRFSLIQNTSIGNDIRYSKDKLESSRNFINKIYNAAKFCIINTQELDIGKATIEQLESEDKWIVTKLNKVILEVTENLDRFEFGVALQKIYDFVWSDFCDTYIEMVKSRLYDKDNITSRQQAMWTLKHILTNSLKLLHPYIPFITEELYKKMIGEDESIMISDWPKYYEKSLYLDEEKQIDNIIDIIREIRNIRNENKIPNNKNFDVIFTTNSIKKDILDGISIIKNLANVDSIDIKDNNDSISNEYTSRILPEVQIHINLSKYIDKNQEIQKLNQEKERLIKELERSERMLSNKGFTDKAPKELIDSEKEKQKKYQDMLDKVSALLEELN